MTELLLLLSIKHFISDYPLQTQSEILHKGIYGNLKGITHSLKHGLGTAAVLLLFTSTAAAVALGLLDFLSHYHIDWLKVQLNKKVEALSKKYWALFGLDQLAHTVVYLLIAGLVVGS